MKRVCVLLLLIIALTQSSCSYDKGELLNPVASACDTLNVTYSASINPILIANCAGCHSGANAPFGIKLDVYSNVNAVALDGRLIGAITHSQGFSPMPKDGAKLNDCNISKISKWVESGAPDN